MGVFPPKACILFQYQQTYNVVCYKCELLNAVLYILSFNVEMFTYLQERTSRSQTLATYL